MRKNSAQKIFVVSVTVFFGVIFVSGNTSFSQATQRGVIIQTAYAEDDDDEDEDDDEEEDDNFSSSSSSSGGSSTQSAPTYKKVLVTKVITTLDPIYTTDQDGDKVVDGLDPHPTIPESEFFTDDDDDAVANAFDTHPGEDDYMYFEQDADANGNGILDSFESLGNN